MSNSPAHLLQVAALQDGLHWGHRVRQLLHMDAVAQDGAHLRVGSRNNAWGIQQPDELIQVDLLHESGERTLMSLEVWHTLDYRQTAGRRGEWRRAYRMKAEKCEARSSGAL